MSVRNARRLLLLAFALSLLIHLLGARLAHWTIPLPADIPERLTMSRVTIHHMLKATPPPQTPKPQPTPRPPARARTTPVAVPHAPQRRGPGAQAAAVQAVPAATPSASPVPAHLPTPAPQTGCADPNAVATVRATAPPPDIPTAARENSKGGIAQIRIALGSNGEITGAAVEGSTGNGALDQVALDYAKGATYSPPLVRCKAVAGSYLFRVKFTTP